MTIQLTLHSTIESFTEWPIDTAAFAAGPVNEPEVNNFVDKGGFTPQVRGVSARAATITAAVDVTTLAEAALPQHMSTAGGTPPPPPTHLPKAIVPLHRTTVPFPKREIFSGIGTTM